MPGKNPFDLPKYQDTQTRVSSSISGGQHAQAAVQPRYPHDPIEKPTDKQPNLRVINGGKSSQSQGTNNPKSQAIPKSVLKRLPPPLLPHPFLWAVVLTVAAGSVLLKEDEIDVMTGKPVEETDPEESVNYLVKEIQNYDPDYTYTHDNVEADINFLANLLHYEKREYYNKHRNACRQDFNPNLFAKTVRDLDAREDILNTLYGQTDTGSEADRVLKMEYENYKANGGTLAYDDWGVLVRGRKLDGNGASSKRLYSNQMPENFAQELADASRVGAKPIRDNNPDFETAINQGTIKYIVTEDGELLISPHSIKNVEISHAVLSGGKDVQAAGQADIAGTKGEFFGLGITSHSGHFMNNATLEQNAHNLQIAKDAFKKLNIIFPE